MKCHWAQHLCAGFAGEVISHVGVWKLGSSEGQMQLTSLQMASGCSRGCRSIIAVCKHPQEVVQFLTTGVHLQAW